jgi:uncharacterized protein YjbI with pentapeptide repeats
MFWRKKGQEKKDKPLTKDDVMRLLRRVGSSDKLDLSNCNLAGIDLTWVVLEGANLRGAYLMLTWLEEADLREADLRGAILTYADPPMSVNLRRANLHGAKVDQKQLQEVWALEGATMPDGTIHP